MTSKRKQSPGLDRNETDEESCESEKTSKKKRSCAQEEREEHVHVYDTCYSPMQFAYEARWCKVASIPAWQTARHHPCLYGPEVRLEQEGRRKMVPLISWKKLLLLLLQHFRHDHLFNHYREIHLEAVQQNWLTRAKITDKTASFSAQYSSSVMMPDSCRLLMLLTCYKQLCKFCMIVASHHWSPQTSFKYHLTVQSDTLSCWPISCV